MNTPLDMQGILITTNGISYNISVEQALEEILNNKD